MSAISYRISVLLLMVWATGCLVSVASAADPKVVKASHESVKKPVAQEVDDFDEDESGYSPQWPEPPNTGAMLFRLCVGTVVVLGLCVGTLWVGKPWLQKLQVAQAANSPLQIEGSVSVGNRATLHLVRIGGIQLVAGTDATGLKSLIALPQSFKEVLDEQVADPEPAPTPAPVPSPLSFGLRAVHRPDSKD